MKITKFFLLGAVLWLISLTILGQCGRGWNGIVPLYSTREDVERRLGASEDECHCLYRTEKEIIYVDYAKDHCKGAVYGWNVPADTVLQFTVTPKIKPLFSQLNLDVSKFVKTSESPMTAYYTNVQEGIRYAVQSGHLTYVEYIPAITDKHLRCEGFPVYDSGVTQYRPYDHFARKTDTEMFAHLDNFAFQLAAVRMSEAYIIAYAGRISKKDEAVLMAEQARQYLINKRNIPPERVISIVGGFRENAEIELYLVPHTMPPPTPTPTLSPSEVKIISEPKR